MMRHGAAATTPQQQAALVSINSAAKPLKHCGAPGKIRIRDPQKIRSLIFNPAFSNG
jgi:hypothetical protein